VAGFGHGAQTENCRTANCVGSLTSRFVLAIGELRDRLSRLMPYGRHHRQRLPPRASVTESSVALPPARPAGLNHSLYDAPEVRDRVALWLREQAGAPAAGLCRTR
jgi:hypothetical protein